MMNFAACAYRSTSAYLEGNTSPFNEAPVKLIVLKAGDKCVAFTLSAFERLGLSIVQILSMWIRPERPPSNRFERN